MHRVLSCAALLADRPQVVYESPPPPGRSRHAMEWLPSLQCLVVLGGADETHDFGDLWLFHLPTRKWTQPTTTGVAPCKRWGLTATHARGKLYVFGGQQTGAQPGATSEAPRVPGNNGESGPNKLALPKLHVDDGRNSGNWAPCGPARCRRRARAIQCR